MSELNFVSPGLTRKAWDILLDLYLLENNKEYTVVQISARLGFSIKDGFFYTKLLPLLIDNEILIVMDESYRGDVGYSSRLYKFDRVALSKYILSKNKRISNMIYIFTEEGEFSKDWIKR